MKSIYFFLLFALCSPLFAVTETLIYESGKDGYHSYRIPSLISTRDGTLLAFCEGRKVSRSDSGDIDLLAKRSDDGGITWSKASVVWDAENNTAGNPCPVVDQRTGRIVMLMTWNLGSDHGRDLHSGTSQDTRRVFQTHSDDDGVSWADPWEITSSVKAPDWWWYATGPGVGIQLEHGPHKGRLVIPANHTAKGYWGSHTLYSDDGGDSWNISSIIKPMTNESQVVELSDGRLMMNMRTQGISTRDRPYLGYRSISFSKDGGESWSAPISDNELTDPVCQASIIRYDENHLLFSNPHVPWSLKRGPRENMTIHLSYNDGETWPQSLTVYQGTSAYSSLAKVTDGTVGLLYEKEKDIVFAKIPIEAIED